MINLQYILVSNHYCTPETNVMLYVNYISIKKKKRIYEDTWHNSGPRVCAQLVLVIVMIYVKY